MKLSTDSWHHRNFRAWQRKSQSRRHRALLRGYRDPDLCTYMRIALIWGPLRRFWSLFDRFDEVFKILIGLFLFVYVFSVGFALLLGSGLSLWHTFLIIPVGYFFVILAAGVGGTKIADLIIDAFKRRSKREPKTRVVKEYIKAKKRRVCPIIEFETE